MIEFTSGNILDSDAEALVNTVNCVGVMGRGIALQFKHRFPANFEAYEAACAAGQVQPGRMFVFVTHTLTSPKFIINFPTKRHWRGKSRIEDIESGLSALVQEIQDRSIRSIAIPPLGSGLGGLNWFDVRPLIEEALRTVPHIHAIIFEPSKVPIKTKSTKVPEMTEGRAALVFLVNQYLRGLMDPFVTLLELHKLMYFLQEAGQPLRLSYTKAHYGPYADNLRHVLSAVEGHLISGYADGGDMPEKKIELVPGALEDAERFLSQRSTVTEKFDRVAKLVEGFETPFGLELLATVHWVVTRESAASADQAATLVHRWNNGKKQFSKHQIGIAYETLVAKGWVNAA